MNSAFKHTLVAMATAALGMTGCGGDAATETADAEHTTGGTDTEASCGGEASCGAADGAADGTTDGTTDTTTTTTTTETDGEASCGEGSCG